MAVDTTPVEADQDAIVTEAREQFQICQDADMENREAEEDDLRFIDLLEQWPIATAKQREESGRPCLTIDKLGAVCRQVENDARLNKPQIKVKPVDSGSDPKTAEIYAGLIRNIEYSSNADVAYDTAFRYAVRGGRGYLRVNSTYASDDTFDQDLIIERISNPFSVYGDPYSTAADSSDWNIAFVIDSLTKDQFEAKYPGKDRVSWDDYSCMEEPWFSEDMVWVAEYWKRVEVEAYALMLSTGEVVRSTDKVAKGEAVGVDDETMEPVTVLAVRPIKSHKVMQYIVSGKELLETKEWPGVFIPIVPFYGDEYNFKGKRYFKSLIRPAKDAQRMFNYSRSQAAEMIGLAPKTPFIGPEEAFNGEDAAKWATANQDNHSYISYKGNQPPQRQAFSGPASGWLQEALNASDDMKAITGVYDASLGARSNETSGVAISARQREGDVSTFHFIDNEARGIRHTGKILVDLIPHFYSADRIIRVLDMEGKESTVRVGTPEEAEQARMKAERTNDEIQAVYALGVGKYDVAVESGPSFTTQRQEAAAALTELLRAAPQYADIIGPFLLKTFDFPGAQDLLDEVKQRIEAQSQQAEQGQQLDPKAMADVQIKMQELQLKAQEGQAKADLERQKLEIDLIRANTEAVKVAHEIRQPTDAPRSYAG